MNESESDTFDIIMKAIEQKLHKQNDPKGGFQMTKSGLDIPPDLMRVIKQRQDLWMGYDQSINYKVKLDELGSRLPNVEVEETIEQPLTTTATPPDELGKAVNLLEAEVKKIADIKKEIERCENGIREEEDRLKKNKIISIVVVILIILAIGYFVFAGLG